VKRLLGVRNLREAGFLTGERSPNRTRSRWGVGGTDLGIPFGEGPWFMAFGDTFESEGDFSAGWRSNVLARIPRPAFDTVPLFDWMADGETPAFAGEILPSRKTEDDEKTVVPTGGFQLGDALYLAYMSVRRWDAPGMWTCNEAGLAKSTDQGRTWRKLDGPRWPGDSGFAQNAALVVEDHVHFWGAPAGRYGPVRLMRVPSDRVEDPDAYAYFLGRDASGEPIYVTGTPAMHQAVPLVPGPCGEPSAAYCDAIGGFLLAAYSEPRGAVLLRAAPVPEGPYGEPVELVGRDFGPMLYGGFLHKDFMEPRGRRIGFALSQWLPTYNVRWMAAELVVSEEPDDDSPGGSS